MFSILITTRNRQDLITKQLIHIQKQLESFLLGFEVIIYDDASSPPIAIEKQTEVPVYLYRGEQNIGLISARNLLVKKAHNDSRYLVFLDDDIFVFNFANALLLSKKKMDQMYSVVSIPFINLPLDLGTKVSMFKFLLNLNKRSKSVAFFFGGSSIFKKSAFDVCGPFESNYFFGLEEEDFVMRMFAKKMSLTILSEENVLAIHDQSPGKNWPERYIFLLSNRLIFHYKFIGYTSIRYLFNGIYYLVYFMKLRNIKMIKAATARYRILVPKIERHNLSLKILFLFFLKRYFNF